MNSGLIEDTGETVTIGETTYDWSYEYTGPHPNAVTKAGPRTFSYDLNGNMTTMVDSSKSVTRSLIWDEENRLKQTKDVSTAAGATAENITTYAYDASGTRVLKKGKYGTVEYVSDNYTVRNKDLISKHVYAGNTRLVSKVIMQEEKSGTMVATEQGSYYYHADHLGSSSVVTDGNGKFYEQIEYFPYGETWIHNKAASASLSTGSFQSTPYKFTSKELDEETGLYYYGARYYDARLSRWVSADPPLAGGDYLPVPLINDKAKEKNKKLPGMGGVFNSINLDVYQYAGQNPIKLVDPDGNASRDEIFSGLFARYGYNATSTHLNAVGERYSDRLGGVASGFLDTWTGLPLSKLVPIREGGYISEFEKGYETGVTAGKVINFTCFATNVAKIAGEEMTEGFIKIELQGIAKDHKRRASFAKGYIQASLPETITSFDNRDEFYGYVIGKLYMATTQEIQDMANSKDFKKAVDNIKPKIKQNSDK